MNRRYISHLFITVLAVIAAACSDDGPKGADTSQVSEAAEYVDPRDGHSYRCLRIGNQVWMAENLAYYLPGGTVEGCYTFNQKTANPFQVTLSKETFCALWTATADDPETPLGNYTAQEYKDWLNDLYVSDKISQAAFLNRFSSRPFRNFMQAFNARWKAYFFAHPGEFAEYLLDAYTIAERNNGGYSKRYGLLYSLDGARKACPEGWRIPTDEDWKTLERTLGMPESQIQQINCWRGGSIGAYLKESEGNGFGAVMSGGDVFTNGSEHLYINFEESCYFWTDEDRWVDVTDLNHDKNVSGEPTTTTEVVREGIVRQLSAYTDAIWRGTTRVHGTYRDVLYSVRCVRDAE